MHLGIIGLGNMGAVMCRRLVAAGYSVRAYDLRRELVESAAESGATAADTVRDAAQDAEVLLLSLPHDGVVREVLLGSEGAISVLRQGSIVVDLSSCNPLATRRTAEELADRGIAMIDAPVSGGVARAVTGDLAVMVGGDCTSFDQVHSILKVLGTHINHVGTCGAGHAAKAINNLVSASTLAITGEAVLLAVKAGLDPTVFIESLNHSTGKSNSSEIKFPKFILNRKFDSGFTLGLMHKDIKIAEALAEELQVPLPVGQAVTRLWANAVAAGGSSADHTALVQYLEQWAGFGLETAT